MEAQPKSEQYPCEVREVYSGDDLVVLIDLGVENLWRKTRVRLLGVDTPNAANAPDDSPAGKIRKAVRQLVKHRRGIFTVHSKSHNSWVGTLLVETPGTPGGVTNLNQHLISQGYVFERSST